MQKFFVLFWTVCVVVMSNHYIDHVSDDGAIFLRYAENIMSGKGAVFNQGEYVEGYSSPLWLLLLCIFSICIPISVVPKILGVAFYGGVLFYSTIDCHRTNHLKFSNSFLGLCFYLVVISTGWAQVWRLHCCVFYGLG